MSDVIEYDIVTKITTERAFTNAEKKAYEAEQALAAKEAAIQAQAELAKAAATAKLSALGLTTDDLKALGLGGN